MRDKPEQLNPKWGCSSCSTATPISAPARARRRINQESAATPATLLRPDSWVLSFRAEGPGAPTAIRIRKLLKGALRIHGLRCTGIRLADNQHQNAQEPRFAGKASP